MKKKAYYLGKQIHSFEDLPIGCTKIQVRAVFDSTDFTEFYSEEGFCANDALYVIKILLRAGRRVPAIKIARLWTGWGLRESKDFVDEVAEEIQTYDSITDFSIPVFSGHSNPHKFFTQLNEGDLFQYTSSFTLEHIKRIAQREGQLKIEYCGPETRSYAKYGSMTCKVVELFESPSTPKRE